MNITGHKKEGYDWFDDSFCTSADISDDISGTSSVNVYVNGDKAFEEKEVSGEFHLEKVTDRNYLKIHESADGRYEIELKARDVAGNITVAEKSCLC